MTGSGTAREGGAEQRHYRDIFQKSRDGFVIVSPSGEIIDANDAYLEMLGYSLEELRALPDFYSITPERWHRWEREEIWERRLLGRGYSGLYEKEYIRSDGTVFPVELQSYAVRDDSGGIDYLWGIARDITERKQRERELRESEARWRSYLENAPFGVFVADRQGRYVDVNPAACRMTGYSREELLSQHMTDMLPPGSREDALDHFGHLPERGTDVIEVPYRRADGEVRWWRVSATVLSEERFLGFNEDVTDRKLAEDSLRRERDRMGGYLDVAGVMLVALDREGRVMLLNRRGCEILGLEREEVLGRVWMDSFIPARYREMVRGIFREVAAGGGSMYDEVEMPVLTAEGDERLVRWRNNVLRGPDGEVTSILSSGEDITDQRRVETALRKSEQELRAVVHRSPVGIGITDSEGRMADCNEALAAIVGYDRERVLEMGFEPLTHPEDLEAERALIGEVFRGERESYRIEKRYLHADGGEVWVDLVGSLVRDEAGEPRLGFAFVQDVTDRKLYKERLEESEAKYRALVMQSADCLILHDLDGTIVDVNESACGKYGYSREELVGMRISDLDPRYDEIVETSGSLESVPRGRSVVFETRHVDRGGTEFPVEVRLGSIEYGGRTLIQGLVRDITERMRAEREREELRERLATSQRLESVGRLAGGVAHDFNNMLGVILGYVDLSLEQLEADSPVVDDLLQVRSAARHSADLTAQLLAFARRQTVAPAVLDLNGTVGSMLRMLERLIGEDVRLLWKPSGVSGTVVMDPSQLEQLLTNLVVNARDAVSAGGTITVGTGRAEVTGERAAEEGLPGPGRYVALEVSDDGHGMPPEVLEHVFEPFFTTKEVGRGTGLGLATVYGIVKQNGGTVAVESEPGAGTRFSVLLPASDGAPSSGVRPAEAIPAGRRRGTILLVEDEEAILRLTDRMLQAMGYEVLAASSPREALRRAREHDGEVDLLLTDVVMPGMDGGRLSEAVLELYPAARVLYMSGYTADIISPHGVLEDGVGFLRKPFSRAELGRKVREALEGDG